jgi:ribokinase
VNPASRPGRVIVIGSANADLVVPAERRPAGGETVLGGALSVHPGGKGANQAVAAGRLGGDVHFVGCVGTDAWADLLRESLTGSDVSTTHLRTSPKATGVALITVTPDGENSILVAPGANGDLTPADVDHAAGLLRPGSVVVMQLEIPEDVVTRASELAARQRARVIINAAPARALPGMVMATADPLVVNESEAAFYISTVLGETMGPPGPVLAGQLRRLGATSTVVTLGADGAFIVMASDDVLVPAVAASVVDTTGAGDSFVAAMAVELAHGQSLTTAVRFGVRVGAVTVGRAGAQSSFPSRGDLPSGA